MNGEIPSVPVTTLAGISSLTDLLPEMPLPSPLPQTLSNKSLLFHPRVAEEAQILLSLRDEALVPQLIQNLSQTCAEHIELKDHYAGAEQLVDQQQQNVPELLKAILQRNPSVFKGPRANSPRQGPWADPGAALPLAPNGSKASPASYGQPSPAYASPCSSRHTPHGSPAPPPAPARAAAPPPPAPVAALQPEQRVSVIAEPRPAEPLPLPRDAGPDAPAAFDANAHSNGPLTTCLVDSRTGAGQADGIGEQVGGSGVFAGGSGGGGDSGKSSVASVQEKQIASFPNNSSASSRESSVTFGQNVVDASVSRIRKGLNGESPAPAPRPLPLPQPQGGEATPPSTNSTKAEPASPIMKKPVVKLSRLSVEDQVLMQKSLKEFAEKSPQLASKLGLTSNHRVAPGSDADLKALGSGSDEDEPRNKSKYFKAREKERELQRQKDKEQKKIFHGDDTNVGVHGERIKRRKRSFPNHRMGASHCDGAALAENCEDVPTPRTKLRKVERKLIPVIEKLSPEELMETNTYLRFNRSIETLFDNTEDLDLSIELDEDADVPPEALIPKYQLQELCSEAAKLKTLCVMESIPSDRLVRLLNILEKNIRDGTRVSPIADPDDDEDESKLWLELTMERVMRAADASLTALYIMTSPNMPKKIYLEDIIDRIVVFTKYQLQNTIYPSFDPVYRVNSKVKESYIGSAKKKRAHAKEVREKSILTLYNKLHEQVGLFSELLNIQILTDNAVLHASSMGVAPFFVENVNELQLSSLKLVTTIFTKYEKHRRLLLDDILASIARLPSSKRSLRTYRLSSEEHIQMLTALVLQLIQCVVYLPDHLQLEVKDRIKEDPDEGPKEKSVSVDRDVFIVSKYETATRTAGNFLTVFLSKCGSKSEDIDYRPLFENFVQDLLTTVNKPEWPATELILSLLGKLLVNNFVNKGTDMSLRVASLDYLGVVAARLRKDAVVSQSRLSTIDQIIQEIKAEEDREWEELGADKKSARVEKSDPDLDPEEERTQFLQRVLLDYLAVSGQNDAALTYARHFYLAQWYKDTTTDRNKVSSGGKNSVVKKKKKARKKRKDETSEEESSLGTDFDEEDAKNHCQAVETTVGSYKLLEMRKQFLISKIQPFTNGRRSQLTDKVLQTYIDYDSAELICRFLASKRPFSRSFDVYLKQILLVLAENSIAVRTKAMKCLTMIVEADPGVLGRVDMQRGVRHSFLDHSTSVREAAVDLVGKFVLSRPELIDKYYDMLSARILDTGVSVRKRVIKILKDICMECPDFPKIPEICVKMIRRVNDEEGIRKLVMEVFQNMWFTPVRERPTLDSTALLRKVMNITDVVAASRDMGLEWFEQLLISLFKPKEDKEDSTNLNVEPPKALLTACKQIVDCLIENVLRLEETSFVDDQGSKGSSQRLVACLTTLYLFAKIRPQLLLDHAITLQPYLSLKCQTQGDYQIISSVARTLELVVPLMEHPSETFLAQLEEDSVKLILLHDRTVVASCLSCLGSVVNSVTSNFKLIRDCFQKYYGHLTDYKKIYMNEPAHPWLVKCRPFFRRALFTVGLLLRHFDFMDKDVIKGLPKDIKDQVFDTLLFFVNQQNEDIQTYTLKAIGSLCIRHYEFMLGNELKKLYHSLLTEDDAPLQMRTQVLNNIEMYLQEEERRMIKQDQEWAKLSKQENLKEMGDVSSGMASTVIQLYLKEILESFLHPNVGVRHAALKVIQLILQQGLVHPVQIVPYLICMSTDMEKAISHSADRQLQDIEKKYPGFIHMKSSSGIRLSYKLQRILQQAEGPGAARGFRVKEGETPGALNGFLYSILRSTKQQRRALVLSILKQFDDQGKISLSHMLYLADNLAYFPYQVQDEPLFIIHHIDIMISVTGTNLLQSFREGLIPNGPQNPPAETAAAAETPGAVAVRPGEPPPQQRYLEEEEEDEDTEALLARLPEDTSVLQDCITASQGCLLLLVLKDHLKELYSFSDAKITQYSPSESAKVYEKAVTRRNTSLFDPKATIQKLKQGSPTSVLDDTYRKALVEQYLDFKQLMLKFDPDDADDDEPAPKAAAAAAARRGGEEAGAPEEGDKTAHPPTVPPLTLQVHLAPPHHPPHHHHHHHHHQPSLRHVTSHPGAKDPPQKIPKLTIVPPRPPDGKDTKHHRSHKSHKLEKHKKHRHKKKRKRHYGSDEDDTENEFSDPDFLL
ncbi:nipped-B-like protein isoform X2 [Bacillus rossius redtenbacheri]|uniref:nipped-B-like protein isoform X2 n=1 Tax=Bacillus rossius redtenbacheri TaxID=93214 RepID=UPI002FDE1525